MVLPSTGPISLKAIMTEFAGGSNLSLYRKDGPYVFSPSNIMLPTAGQPMSLSKFYAAGTESPWNLRVTSSTANSVTIGWNATSNATYLVSEPSILTPASNVTTTSYTFPNVNPTQVLNISVRSMNANGVVSIPAAYPLTYTITPVDTTLVTYARAASTIVYPGTSNASNVPDMTANKFDWTWTGTGPLLSPFLTTNTTTTDGSSLSVLRCTGNQCLQCSHFPANSDYTKQLVICTNANSYYKNFMCGGVGGIHLVWRNTVGNLSMEHFTIDAPATTTAQCSMASFQANKWIVLMATFVNSSRLGTIYLNGISMTSNILATGSTGTSCFLSDYLNNSGNNSTNVDFLEWGYYNVALTQTQISAKVATIQTTNKLVF
jgi:hypothetical protein